MNLAHNRENIENREERKPLFDLNKVDYKWIEKTNNVKELKAAYHELQIDGYFPDLMKVCG